MKFNAVLALGLGVLCLNIGAADPAQQKIRVVNNTGYEVQLQVGRLDEGQGYSGTSYIYQDIRNNRDYTIPDSSSVNQLGVKFKYTAMGSLNQTQEYDQIDVSGQSEHPGDTLVITIESYRGYDSYLYFDFNRNWMKPSEGARIEQGWEEVKDVNQLGQEIYHNITGPGRAEYIERLQQDPQQYLQEIVTFLNYWFTIADKKNQGFDQGTFLIEDPRGHIFSFLNSYPGVYDRTSSHLIEFMKEEGSDQLTKVLWKDASLVKGLDAVGDYTLYNMWGEGMIPGSGMRHLFFTNAIPGYTMVKPEDWGTSWGELGMHSIEFVKSLMRKSPAMKALVGTDDEPTFRKERIPAAILTPYKEIIDTLFQEGKFTEEEKIQKKNRAKAYGIHEMNRELLNIQQMNDIPQEVHGLVEAVLVEINQYDHLDVRIGREVVITQDELRTGTA